MASKRRRLERAMALKRMPYGIANVLLGSLTAAPVVPADSSARGELPEEVRPGPR
jgi:hypothetical protein